MTGTISREHPSLEKNDNRRALKETTAHVHEAVENAWFRDGEFASLGDYSKWLRAMLQVHSQLGFCAAHTIADPKWIELEATRVACLAQDLGQSINAERTCPTFSASFAWGVSYALNGSALGATVLVTNPSIQSHWPRRYLIELYNFAKSGGVRAFFDQLNRCHLDLADAKAGAASVFATLSSLSVGEKGK